MTPSGTLILGWGNPGRLDDGLGPAFVEILQTLDLPGVEVDSDYQLQIEDAAEVASFQRVVFVDADRTGAEPTYMTQPGPQTDGRDRYDGSEDVATRVANASGAAIHLDQESALDSGDLGADHVYRG